MIPLRLELTNFLSYRQTAALDFEGLHLACIAGLNGAGKSSILDGLTWALFGQSRSKNDDDVVNRLAARNNEEARVLFDFSLDGQIYRILRRKRHSKTMQVELQVAADYEAGDWKSLTRAKRRETDEAIEELLRMNFETFSNASFLLQGKADEFTTKTAGRRKEILAELLGVNQWEVYKEAIVERRKTHESQLALLDGQLTEIELELTEEPKRQADYQQVKAEYALVKQQLEAKEQVVAQNRQTAEAAEQQKKLVTDLGRALERTQQTLQEWRNSHQKQAAERAQYTTILEQADTIQSQYQAWQTAEQLTQTWQQKADQLQTILNQKKPLEFAIAQEESRLRQHQTQLLAQQTQVEAMQQERVTVESQQKTAEKTLATLQAQLIMLLQEENRLNEARAELQRLEAERQLLLQEQKQWQVQERKAEQARTDQQTLQTQTQQAHKLIEQLTADLEQLTAKQITLNETQTQRAALESEQTFLKGQMDQLKNRISQIEGLEGDCPLCGQPLAAGHKTEVLAELQQEGKNKGDKFRENKTTLAQYQTTLTHLEKEVQARPKVERELQTQQKQAGVYQTRLEEAQRVLAEWQAAGVGRLAELTQQLAHTTPLHQQENLVKELQTKLQAKGAVEKDIHSQQKQLSLAEARLIEINRLVTEWQSTGIAQLSTVTHSLSTGHILPDQQAQLLVLEEQAAAVGYDPAGHQQAKQAREELKQAPQRFQQWEKATTAVQTLDSSLANLAHQITQQEADVAERQQTLTQAQQLLATLQGQVHLDLRSLERELQKLREAEVEANRRVGRAEQNLRVLDQQRERQNQLEQERRELTHHIQRLKMLEKACGRDGVQALLIEQALPEIEERANELLERLTDGRMRLEFDTQKELKSRSELAETLDIRISDAAGVRPYENFSGGEQFRINFAIRIALSQILAKRAGAKLQTLVIDEGFGSQDPEGQQRLVEAINTIQHDFARILIITHIATLRDAFPNRIEVLKTATGSQIAVL